MIKSTEAKKKLIELFTENDWQPLAQENCVIPSALSIESMRIYDIYFGKLGYIRSCVIAGKNYYRATEKLEKAGKKTK